ncbi:hypothetical protein NSMS1_50400 [Nostoc sp. MS1]|nr:hypothetical protein NSMS1_50400 [Nostoc sp. MS1]
MTLYVANAISLVAIRQNSEGVSVLALRNMAITGANNITVKYAIVIRQVQGRFNAFFINVFDLGVLLSASAVGDKVIYNST